jgi:hypothetical protein
MADIVIAGGILLPIHRSNFTSVAAPIAETFTANAPCEILEIRVHLSAAATGGNFIVTLDSGNGAAYDTVLSNTAMAAVQDIWLTNVGVTLDASTLYGDALTFGWANDAQEEKTVGIEVIWRTP